MLRSFPIANESSYVNAHTLFLDAGPMAATARSQSAPAE
jgi:hypothetical protein